MSETRGGPTAEPFAEKVFSPVDCVDDTVTIQSNGSEVKTAVVRPCGGKRKWIAVCVVLSILLVLTITLILVLVFVPRHDILINKETNRYFGDREVNEIVYMDSEESLMKYHFVNANEESWVILDLNRDLEIMKIKTDSEPVQCFLSPLAAFNPRFSSPGNYSFNETAPDNDYNWNNKSAVVDFMKSPFPLKDKSILGPKGMALCSGAEVFWSLPLCYRRLNETNTTDAPSGPRRKKRGSWYRWWIWDWSYCYYYSYPERRNLFYYRCDVTYTWIWI